MAITLTYSFGTGTLFDKLFATQLQADLTALGAIPDTASIWTATQTFTGLAAIAAADGTVGAPSITLGSDLDSGFYKKAANSIAMSLGGADVVVMSTTTASFIGAVSMTNGLTVSGGAVSLPAGSIANAALATPAGTIEISTVLASATAQIDFTTGIDATYDDYYIGYSLSVSTDDVTLDLQIGTPGIVTANYQYSIAVFRAGITHSSSTSAAAMVMTSANVGDRVGNAAGEHISGDVTFSNPESTTLQRLFQFNNTYVSAGGLIIRTAGAGAYSPTGTAVSALRIKPSSGNITGRATLYAFTK